MSSSRLPSRHGATIVSIGQEYSRERARPDRRARTGGVGQHAVGDAGQDHLPRDQPPGGGRIHVGLDVQHLPQQPGAAQLLDATLLGQQVGLTDRLTAGVPCVSPTMVARFVVRPLTVFDAALTTGVELRDGDYTGLLHPAWGAQLVGCGIERAGRPPPATSRASDRPALGFDSRVFREAENPLDQRGWAGVVPRSDTHHFPTR